MAPRLRSTYSAKSADTLRRNAAAMPPYTVTLPLLFFAAYAMILVMPGLKNGDLALLLTVRKALLLAKNFARPLFAPSMTDDGVTQLGCLTLFVRTVQPTE